MSTEHDAGNGDDHGPRHFTTRRGFVSCVGFGVVSLYGLWAAYGAAPLSFSALGGEGGGGGHGGGHGGGGMSPDEFRELAEAFIEANELPDGSVKPQSTQMAAMDMSAENGAAAHAEGEAAHLEAEGAHVEAEAAHVDAPGAHADGEAAHVEAEAAHLEVEVAHVEAEAAHTHAEGEAAHAEVEVAHVEPVAAHIEGEAPHVEGEVAHVEGEAAHVEGEAAHVEGDEAHDEVAPIDIYIMASRYYYEPDVLRLVVNTPYRLRVMAMDTGHGASINMDAGSHIIRGPAETLLEKQITFTAPGEHLVYCTVYCGEGHDFMRSKIIVEAA